MNSESLVTQPKTHVLAIVSLILSILGLTPVLPVLGSISGIVTGIIARSEIRSRPEAFSGESLARAGIILGLAGIVLGFLLICALLAFLVPIRVNMS